jgi:ketosteroid isomerase-like protein
LGIEHNRRVGIALIEGIAAKGLDDTLLAPGFTWWAAGVGTMDKEQFQRSLQLLRASEVVPAIKIVATTAEGDRVAMEAEASAVLLSGFHYNNRYHFLAEFENGRVKAIREYNDTKHSAEAFPGF